ncbi:NUDIX domain-containing protein [Gammaproteobacteria bacterium]|nr:NUDIX domain-containing protein [Gammaproteobacteria bacterium]
MHVNDERLPLVSALDRQLGEIGRGEAHRRGLRHRSVHILLFRGNGDLVLQRRALDRAVAPGLLDSSAAGHVAAGESYIDAARRELNEELGVLANGLLPLVLLPAEVATGNEFCLVLRVDSDASLVPCEREILALETIPARLLPQRIVSNADDFSPTLKRIVTALCGDGRWPSE